MIREYVVKVTDTFLPGAFQRFESEWSPEQELIRCKDCKHWDKTTRREGNDCILGPWEDAVCDRFRDWDRYGELGEDFGRTDGDWYCADGERKDENG